MKRIVRNWRRAALVTGFVVPFVLVAPAAAQEDEEPTFSESVIANATAFRESLIASLTERFGLPESE